LDHISAVGWSPVFYLWPGYDERRTSLVECLEIITARSGIEFEVLDINGWAIIHRAAAYGTVDEVAHLLKLGASIRTTVGPLKWTAIHESVFHGNFPVFLDLLPRYSELNEDINTPDLRGWSLLHIAASAGHDEIIRHLLSLGADPRCRSKPYNSHMPESLYNKRITPGEAAKAKAAEAEQKNTFGKERFSYQVYLKALYDHGLTDTDELEYDEQEDTFWDAIEEVELPA
jgi:ankyrin repeat protein